ncbi:MAG: hypothetical protein E7296_02900 [Lachnospiraceae bacterium]|jgi:hypothetical protein|nr:hypothetical protein [Lachnospiraceae bacterium]
MGENEKKKFSLSKKQLIIIGAVAAAVVIGVVLFIVINNNSLKATTMKLLRMEGTVTLEENGETKTVKENLRFKSGDAISTEVKSLVSVGLDDTKIVTLDEESRAEFQKDGKDLELTLTDGQLFFNVTEKLDADASFNIRNSDMVVGIRGTSGVIVKDRNGRPILYLTDGEVEISAKNPVTGESKTITVKPGTRVSVYYYSDRPIGETVQFCEVPLAPDMIPEFAVDQMCSDEELLSRITEATGWEVTDVKKLGDEVKEGNYVPKESEPINLGLMDPDDLIPKDPETEPAAEEPVEEPKEPEEPEQPEEPEAPAEEPQEETTPQVQEPIDYSQDATVRAAIKYIGEDGTIYLTDDTVFDWEYYAKMNPDVVKAYGNDPYALLYHYLTKGQNEDSRFANAEEEHQVAAEKVEEQRKAEQFQKEQEEANRRAAEEENNQEASNQSSNSNTSSISAAEVVSRIQSLEMGESVSYGGMTIQKVGDGYLVGDIVTNEFTAGDGYIEFSDFNGTSFAPWRLYENGTLINTGG